MCMAKKMAGAQPMDQQGQPMGMTDSIIYAMTNGKHRLKVGAAARARAGGAPSNQGVIGPSPSFTGG